MTTLTFPAALRDDLVVSLDDVRPSYTALLALERGEPIPASETEALEVYERLVPRPGVEGAHDYVVVAVFATSGANARARKARTPRLEGRVWSLFPVSSADSSVELQGCVISAVLLTAEERRQVVAALETCERAHQPDTGSEGPGHASLPASGDFLCHGCGDVVAPAVWHGGEPYCQGCDATPAESALSIRQEVL